MNRTDFNHTPPNGTGDLDELVQAVGQAHRRLQATVATVEALAGQPPTPGDLWVLPAAVDPAAVDPAAVDPGAGDSDDFEDRDLGDAIEWAVLETDERGALYLVPVDACPLLGTADVTAPECRVLRCSLGIWLGPKVFEGARRTGVLDADTLATARQRCRALAGGGNRGSLEALETDRDPEYVHLILGMARAKEALEQRYGMETRAAAPTAEEPLEASRHQPLGSQSRPRRWALPATLAASLLLTVLAIQWRTITELRRGAALPIVDPSVVWLVPGGDRGPLETQTAPAETEYVVFVMNPEPVEPSPEVYRLEIFTADEEEAALWSNDLSPGELPELFVLVPGRFLAAGDYRLELTGRRKGEETPAGHFLLRVVDGASATLGGT